MIEKEEPVPPLPGKARCLKCGKEFQSRDKRRLRICPGCSKINESLSHESVSTEYLREALGGENES